MARTKYHRRANGTLETTRSYNGKIKHFYGHSDADIDKKISEYENALREQNMRYFKDVAEEWWQKKEPEISPNCIRGYKCQKEWAVDELGDIPCKDITPLDIITALRKVAAQGYSQKAINNRKIVVKGILDYALICGDIQVNPCLNIPIIKGRPAQKRKPATDEDIKIIERTKLDSNISRLYYFMLYTGCRLGEAVALQQKDIDVKGKTARICKSVAYAEQTPIIKPPKTEAGLRSVDLYDNVIEILPHYRSGDTFIFFPDGLPTKCVLERLLKKYQKDNGISATAHQLRHSYATLLHSASVNVKDAQSRLGHSSVIVTQDIYTDIETNYNSQVREQINEYIKEHRN